MTRPQVYQSQTTPCRALCEMRSGVMQCSAELLPTIHDANANGAYALLVGQHCGTGTAREMERACACPQALRSIGVASDHHLVSPGQTACACSLTSQLCPYLQVSHASRGVHSRSGVLWRSVWSVQAAGLPYSVSQEAKALALALVNVHMTAAPRARAQARAAPRAARRGARGSRCARRAPRPAQSPAAPGRTPPRSAARVTPGLVSHARRTAT